MEPKIVSNGNPINGKVFALIAGILISLQVVLLISEDPEFNDNLVFIVSILNPSVATVISFVIYKRYAHSLVFGNSYFVLGLGFLMIVLAEITYITYDFILNEDPYPSIADVFFFAFYPCVLFHLIKNIKFFGRPINLPLKAGLALLAISIISVFSFLAYEGMGGFNFDYFYGVIFVSIASITLAVSILGAKSFKGGTLGKVWLILVLGLFLLVTGDTIYYYLELFEEYSLEHPVNLLWYAGYWVIIYSLIKHKNAI